jgi:hypothetical protein
MSLPLEIWYKIIDDYTSEFKMLNDITLLNKKLSSIRKTKLYRKKKHNLIFFNLFTYLHLNSYNSIELLLYTMEFEERMATIEVYRLYKNFFLKLLMECISGNFIMNIRHIYVDILMIQGPEFIRDKIKVIYDDVEEDKLELQKEFYTFFEEKLNINLNRIKRYMETKIDSRENPN